MPKALLVIIVVLAIIIFLVLTVSFITQTLFEKRVEKEVRTFLSSNVENPGQIIQKSDLAVLPPVVQKWLERSQVLGKERITSARSKQKAVMRLKEENPWMPLEAEQYFTVDKPGYIWKAKVKAAPFITLAARDKYDDGQGNVLIKLLALKTVADSRGKEVDQGSMVRFLAETVWIPTAALSDYITWEEIDAKSARATMSYKGITASGVFNFNDRGEVVEFVAPRYGDFDGHYTMETWAIILEDYKEFDGVRVPAKGEVEWKLETGDFNWYRFEVLDIEYNNPCGVD